MNAVEAIYELENIFAEKGWNKFADTDLVYSDMCVLLENLTSSQRTLILNLVKLYKWISLGEYYGLIYQALNSLSSNSFDGVKNVIFFPVHKPDDEGRKKTKSGHRMLYDIHTFQPSLRKRYKISTRAIETFRELGEAYPNGIADDEALVLVDDFLGSEDTISQTLSAIEQIADLECFNIRVFVIACQKTTEEYLNGKRIPIHYTYRGNKGITDNCESQDMLRDRVRVMTEIENKIPRLKQDCRFGHKQSEALITLARTPNNTFPIFRMPHKIGNKEYEAPFSRY